MNAAEAAALIAAVFWALLVCVGVFVLFRLARLLSESSKLAADMRERGGVLLTRAQLAVDGAQQAVDRAGRQLDRRRLEVRRNLRRGEIHENGKRDFLVFFEELVLCYARKCI